MGRLILLPGLGADERMFGSIDPSGLPLVPCRHLVPARKENLPSFAQRTAEHLDIGTGDVIGGASFGSMVAAAIAHQRRVRALVLIGGALDGSSLRPIPGAKITRFLPAFILRPLLRSDRILQHAFAVEGPEAQNFIRAMLTEAPDDLLLQGSRMLLAYRAGQPPPCPVFAIHGGRDPIMAPPVPGCSIIPEAGHGLLWTHGHQITAFLRQLWAECRDGNRAAAGP
jgi:pimeloyl-ACP methyl ester carboxylesterase